MLSRRSALTSLIGLVSTTALARSATAFTNDMQAIVQLEREVGGRIGLAVLDTASGRQLSHRPDERFAMCSTFKLMLAAAVLSKVDEGTLQLEQRIAFTREEVLPNSPVAEAHPDGGSEPLRTMLESAIEASDNTAANRLLALVGGPPGYTAYLRGLGDATTRLDRVELALNSNLPGDARDTTTPRAMVENMRQVLVGNRLSSPSRARLLEWLRDCRTGHDRLRARLPAGWEAGDKTGTGVRGAVNDLAIFFPPNRRPILVACYMGGSAASMEALNAAQARIGAMVAATMR
jgi:beta-lactamase class A